MMFGNEDQFGAEDGADFGVLGEEVRFADGGVEEIGAEGDEADVVDSLQLGFKINWIDGADGDAGVGDAAANLVVAGVVEGEIGVEGGAVGGEGGEAGGGEIDWILRGIGGLEEE